MTDDDRTRAFPSRGDGRDPHDPTPWNDPADPPTTAIPPAGGDATTAWSSYDNPDRDPTVTTGPVPPVTMPADRRESDLVDDGHAGGRGLVAVIAALTVAVLAVLGVVAYVLLHDRQADAPTPTRTTTSSAPAPSPTTSASRRTPTTQTSPTVLSREARCASDYLWRQFGSTVTPRACNGEYAVLAMPSGEHQLGLYHWESERWSFVADPYSGVCRDQLTRIGVPPEFQRDFPPCTMPPTGGSTQPTSEGNPSSTPGTSAPGTPGSTTQTTPGTSAPSLASPTASPESSPAG